MSESGIERPKPTLKHEKLFITNSPALARERINAMWDSFNSELSKIGILEEELGTTLDSIKKAHQDMLDSIERWDKAEDPDAARAENEKLQKLIYTFHEKVSEAGKEAHRVLLGSDATQLPENLFAQTLAASGNASAAPEEHREAA